MLQAVLSKMVAALGGDWVDHLWGAVLSYNSTPSEATAYSPYMLMFGEAPMFPSMAIVNHIPSRFAPQMLADEDRNHNSLAQMWKEVQAARQENIEKRMA